MSLLRRSKRTSPMVEEEEEESIQPLLKKKRTGDVGEFCADVYGLEILSYLPAKSVQALEIVCKDWLDLIRSSYFVRFHLSRCNRSRFRVLVTTYFSDCILECNNFYQESKRQITYPPQFFVCSTILGSADGLIFMLQRNREYVSALFNPSTGKYFEVQLSPSLPLETHCILCSWFGKLGDGEYGLVMVIRFGGPRHEIWVYKFTLNSKIIKRISSTEFISPTFFVPIEKIGNFVQGVVHWPVQYGSRSAILAYHISEDIYFEISPPVQCGIGPGLFVDGCSLFATTKNMGSVAELWIMKQDHSWSKYANIEGSNNLKTLSPLGFSPDGGDLIMDVGKSKLMKYSFNHKESTFLMEYGNRRQVIMCADTLVSPGCC